MERRTLRELLVWGSSFLKERGIAEYENDAWLLLEHVTGLHRAEYFLRQQDRADTETEDSYCRYIKRRGEHIPLQHLTGVQEFMGLEFAVNEDVLVPRQDTELLVEKVIACSEGKRILDLCTGSGCIAVSVALLGHPASVDAVDLSEKALQVARRNAEALGAQVFFRQSDMLENAEGPYDMIVSNPPYIASETVASLMPEVREHEPLMALDGGRDGLDFYRKIARTAGSCLVAGGVLWLEIGYDQRDSVSALLQQQGFAEITCYRDLAGKNRVIQAVWPGVNG